MRRRLAESLAIAFVVASLVAGAASGPSSLEAAKIKTPTVDTITNGYNQTLSPWLSQRGALEVGIASWYGDHFQGRQTASGEVFDMRDFTAAHPSLPLGTFVRVTNLRNGRAVVVKINDRGPVVDGRIIDLSYNAARALGFKDKGLQKVRLDIAQPASHFATQPANRLTTLAQLHPLAKLN